MRSVSYEDLDQDARRALDAAETALPNSYSPYSKFRVGAALYAVSGEVVAGTNYENASYNSICAERAAIVSANTQGIRQFAGIAIIGGPANFSNDEVIAPCGLCRQVLNEVAQLSQCDLTLVLASPSKAAVVLTCISELLPLSFGPNSVGVNILEYAIAANR